MGVRWSHITSHWTESRKGNIRRVTRRRRFITNADDLMSYRCFFKELWYIVFFSPSPHIFPTWKRVTCNTLLLETDVDFIAGVCGFSHNVDTMSYAPGYQDTFAWHTHLSPAIQHAAVTPYTSETQESNVSLHDEQKVSAREGRRGCARMHNLSKSRPSSYLFTDLFNKEKKNMQTNEFARGCNCVLRSSLTRPGLL